MTDSFYIISFDYDGIHYDGRVTPEIKKNHSTPSYHVVLNEVFFGYVHQDKDHWQVSEQRPSGLVQAVGEQIQGSPHEIQMID